MSIINDIVIITKDGKVRAVYADDPATEITVLECDHKDCQRKIQGMYEIYYE